LLPSASRRLHGVVAALAFAVAGCGAAPSGWDDPRADPAKAELVAQGAKVYAQHCAACHGANLEGHPDWRKRLPSGRMQAPPHDDSGHTWHHSDQVLFLTTRDGMVPPLYPQGYASDMPAFGQVLSEAEIWAVLAFIKSRWSDRALAARTEMGRHAVKR